MPVTTDVLPEVYSAREIALAAGVQPRDVCRWADAHGIHALSGGFYPTAQAVRLVRQLVATVSVAASRPALFACHGHASGGRALQFAATAAAHVVLVAGLILAATAPSPSRGLETAQPVTTQLVFLPLPGAGGGGGGGGRKELIQASAAERRGLSRLRSPIRPRPVAARIARAVEQRVDKPDEAHVIAPVVPVEADSRDVPGEAVDVPSPRDSRGPGADGEAGAGTGGGIGPGNGAGLGAGTRGGTGGGPFRPGADINPPSLLREVKPDYTEEGRRRSVEGDVDLEIVVRSDGGVGDVTLVRGLGAGLDERAVDAVRQWRFSPATRHGAPVDVVVQVSVEFRLR